METKEELLPSAEKLETWLDLRDGGVIQDLIESSLLAPLTEFLSRPGKNLRGKLVEFGFELVNCKASARDYVAGAVSVLETIHAASLVVDDIQDDSEWRRGKPTLHRTHGLAVALNGANWLYFWPFEKIQSWNLIAEVKNQLIAACYRALIRAHSGQALDVGTLIQTLPQRRVAQVCLASLELKTGALTSLAIEMGAILAGASSEQLKNLSRFGSEFGIALQMFDDLGNIKKKNPPDPKRFEDLKLGRPSWVWASASKSLSEAEYSEFIQVVKTLPDLAVVDKYFDNASWVISAKEKAAQYLDHATRKLQKGNWDSHVMEKIQNEVEGLKKAYG